MSMRYVLGISFLGPTLMVVGGAIRDIAYAGLVSTSVGAYLLTAKFLHYQNKFENASFGEIVKIIGKGVLDNTIKAGWEEIKDVLDF